MNGQAHDGRHHDRIDPEVHLGPLTLAWHGITIALGFLLGGVVAARWLRRHGLDVEPLYQLIAIAAIAANRRESPRSAGSWAPASSMSSSTTPGALVVPDRLISSRGFTFDGGLILAAILVAVYVHRRRLGGLYHRGRLLSPG